MSALEKTHLAHQVDQQHHQHRSLQSNSHALHIPFTAAVSFVLVWPCSSQTSRKDTTCNHEWIIIYVITSIRTNSSLFQRSNRDIKSSHLNVFRQEEVSNDPTPTPTGVKILRKEKMRKRKKDRYSPSDER